MLVTVLSSASFLSMGDAMRELDAKAFIRSDFILVSGYVITTLPLDQILESHKKRRETDKGCAMTLIYRKALPGHRTRCHENDTLVAVESQSQRLRYYQRTYKKRTLNLPLEIFQEVDEMSVHYDLLDCHVSICSPCVPPLFSDNFDYQCLDDFVKGLIVNEELLGNSMYIHVAEMGYGAAVSNFSMYHAVSQDIIGRWAYPIVPDSKCARHNIYKEDIELGRNCSLLQNVVVGGGSRIGNGVKISHSVIGRHCQIGDNVVMCNAYVWDGAVIGEECQLDTCLLAENVVLQKAAHVTQGCILGNNVVIGAGQHVAPFSKLQVQKPSEEDDFGEPQEKEDNMEYAVELVGVEGRGYECVASEGGWGEADDNSASEEEETASTPSAESDQEGFYGESDDEATAFYNEVLDSLQRAIEEQVKSENVILEINSSKYAYNVSMKEVNTLLVKAILEMPVKKATSPQQYWAALRKNLIFLQTLLKNYLRNNESQNDCLASIQNFMENHTDFASTVLKILHFLYEGDLLSESAILGWYESLPTGHHSKTQVSAFVEWLREADEESSEDE